MADISSQIQAFTCIGEEAKKKIIAACVNLDDVKAQKVIAILSQGEAKKKALGDMRDSQMLGLVEQHLKEIDEFKKGPLKQGVKQAEIIIHTGEDKAAEDLLKGI